MQNNEEKTVEKLIQLFIDLRKSAGLTLEGLADLAGLHRTSVSLYERRERSPSVQAAIQLAQALNIPLSTLLKQAEDASASSTTTRQVNELYFQNSTYLQDTASISPDMLRNAINDCYRTFDLIDDQLILNNTPPISQLVELANLSSIIGNLLGGAIVKESNGLYKRNTPHKYPDLLPLSLDAKEIEIKMALEKNTPKGHLPKEGYYMTFRYVLADKKGRYIKGVHNRGDTVWIWEIRFGFLKIEDFQFSSTLGDSGKTAPIKTVSFNGMPILFVDPLLNPYKK